MDSQNDVDRLKTTIDSPKMVTEMNNAGPIRPGAGICVRINPTISEPRARCRAHQAQAVRTDMKDVGSENR